MSQALVKFDAKTAAASVARLDRAARNAAAQGVLYALRCGDEIRHAQQSLPHGEFLPWLESTGVKKSSAYNYAALAEKIGDRMLKFPTVGNLLELAAGDLTEDQSELLAKASRKISGGKALTQLYMDFGIVKSGADAGPKGGDNEWAAWLRKHHPALIVDGKVPKRKPSAVGEEVWKEWEKFCAKKGAISEAERRQYALEDCRHLEEINLKLGIRNPDLMLAPIADRAALRDTLTELAKLLTASLKD